MKALPKLSKAQQEAWARILEWYAQEDRKEAFISGKARWGVSPSAVPAGKNTLDALRDKGLLVYAPRKGYQPLHYAIHPDYLPASEPAVDPESEPVAVKPAAAVQASRYTPKGGRVTPLRMQYLDIKSKYPDYILFFRLGDFYETFDHDAEIAAEVCDLVLTSRPVNKSDRIPMAGVPYHSIEKYIEMLRKAQYRVAVAEQVTEPSGMGIVERAVTKTYEPAPAGSLAVDTPRFNVGDKVTPLKGKWEGHICTVVDVFVDLYGITRIMINNDAFNWRGAFSYKELELVKPAASEPATDDRPTTDEARLMDSITEARMERDIARNEVASLKGQLEALRVRFAEVEEENRKLYEQVEKLNDEAEALSGHIVQVEKARDFWRGKKEDIEVALGVQRATSEQWETRAKAAEAIIKAFHS